MPDSYSWKEAYHQALKESDEQRPDGLKGGQPEPLPFILRWMRGRDTDVLANVVLTLDGQRGISR
jgi:hypothetical protein